MESGRSVRDWTSWMVLARIAGSSASGMPALTSSICAPAATWASVSASTVVKSPAAISAARRLRPVGLIRSPMTQNGASKPMRTVFVAELTTVSVMALDPLARSRLAASRTDCAGTDRAPAPWTRRFAALAGILRPRGWLPTRSGRAAPSWCRPWRSGPQAVGGEVVDGIARAAEEELAVDDHP